MRVRSFIVVFIASLLLTNATCMQTKQQYRNIAIHEAFKYNRGVDLDCVGCHAVVGGLHSLVQSGTPLEELEALAIDVCKTAHLFTDDVCEQMVYLSAPEVVYVVNYTSHSVDTLCNHFFGTCPGSLPEWTIDVPTGKPTPSHPDPIPGPSSYRVLHLADSHFEPMYEEGTPTVCTHPLCCRAWGDPNDDNTTAAGKWGAESGDCDAPQRTLEAALQAAAALQPDIVYMTGDIPAHDVWAQSHQTIIDSIRVTANLISQYLPGVPVAYTLGNHEAAPVNSYAVPEVYADGWDMDWLYTEMQQVWGAAGLPAEAMPDVLRGGYYHWSPVPGFRIVAVNCNYGFHQNWFLMMNHVDPTGQLQWLSDVLLAAEQAGEKVHILGHVAPGGLMESFSHSYNKLISRFESTITGLFGGHSHDDQLKILWDVEDNTRPVAATYIAPSISSNGKKSPSFRIYDIDGGYDGATWGVLDTYTYSMNLTLANQGAAPDFPLAYTASQAYGITSLTPQSWADVVWNMATDDELFNEYQRHYYSFWAEPEELGSCTIDCRRDVLCGIYSGDKTDKVPCERIMAQVTSNATVTVY